jgi:hypothetical protein
VEVLSVIILCSIFTEACLSQLLEINRRVQKQNNVPKEFPLFVRNGFNIKVVADGYETAPSGLIYKVTKPLH